MGSHGLTDSGNIMSRLYHKISKIYFVLFAAALVVAGMVTMQQFVSSKSTALAAATNEENTFSPHAGNLSKSVAWLCIPVSDFRTNEDCLLSGPSQYLANLAKFGISLPPIPLPARPPDRQLAVVPYRYAQVVGENAPMFGLLEDAIRGTPILYNLETGFDFVTYTDLVEQEGKRYFMVDAGVWMRGEDLSRISATSSFQGLEFRETPKNNFGWMRNEAEVKRTPGYEPKDYTGQILYRYDLVQVYQTKKIDDMEWYLIGPDQWVEGRQVGRVIVNLVPPKGVTNGRWIEVNLAEQTIAIYEKGRLIFATLMASGREGAWTRPGLFQIYKKVEAETMRGATTADRSDFYYLEDVPWTMYFDKARALHGTFWHNRFGWPQSRGCVNLSTGDAHWLYEWAKEGEWVYVWDPTGQTPTDPSFYGEGGA